MKNKGLLVLTLVALIAPVSAFANTGTIKFKGGCAVSNSGSCTIGISGYTGNVKLYAASAPDGKFGAVSRSFAAPGSKRIANSKNNVCFYAKDPSNAHRTPIICLAK